MNTRNLHLPALLIFSSFFLILAKPAQSDDTGKLNPVVGRILEQHGIVGNAAHERSLQLYAPVNPDSLAGDDSLEMAREPGSDLKSSQPGPEVKGFIIRFADEQAKILSAKDQAPSDALLEILNASSPLEFEFSRAMSMGSFVFEFREPVSWEEYQLMQEALQELGIVERVAPEIIKSPKLVPNDPFFRFQWDLLGTGSWSDSVGEPVVGINAVEAWDLVLSSDPIPVAVLDTGISNPPPMDAGRVLPGYDFISDPDMARDGDGRDPNPFDNGNHRDTNECEHQPEASSSNWHGTQITSVIAARGNNGSGLAGINWEAEILPVRVLGKCGGRDSDIIDGMLWAAGLAVPGVPLNENPARILNMSLGATYDSECSGFFRDAFDLLQLHNVVIVAAAGNDNDEAAFHEPSNCPGTISVGAVDHRGERASYSNWSKQGAIDISAPGGNSQRFGNKGALIAIVDSGSDGPKGELAVIYTNGTSAAAALVSGALSLAMRLDPLQHTDLLVSIMHETAQPFGAGTECEREYPKCGVGILDLAAMIRGAMVFKDYAIVRDFYHADLKHYFRSGNWDEVSLVLRGVSGQWDEQEDMFLAWRDNKVIGTHPVCRFYGTPGIGPNSHFYTVDNNECEFIKQNDPGWTYEGVAFYAKKAYSTGGCPRATYPVYRYYNQKAHLNDSNHRYTTHLADRASMEAQGWVMEGTAMCVPEI